MIVRDPRPNETAAALKRRKKWTVPLSHPGYSIEPCPKCGYPEAEGVCPECGWSAPCNCGYCTRHKR